MDVSRRETEKNSPNVSITQQLVHGGGEGRGQEYRAHPASPPRPRMSQSLSFPCLASENALDPLMNLFLDYIEGGKEGRRGGEEEGGREKAKLQM